MSIDNLIPSPLTPRHVRSYINFDGCDFIDPKGSSQSRFQSRGVAALWHLLETKRYAYLGDEVGMGKTRQAMGVLATQFLKNPNSHVVIVCPGRPLQDQWSREWEVFIRTCYKAKDDRLTSVFDGTPIQTPALHDRLRDFARSLLLNESRIHLLRYSSFSRPIWFDSEEETKSPRGVFERYRTCLREMGIAEPSAEEHGILLRYQGEKGELPDEKRKKMTADLNHAYARRVGQLLRARDIDLVIFDEAQYLRHLGNLQNTNIRHVFRTHVEKWLFMSATPLHTSEQDVVSLDAYLCHAKDGYQSPAACRECLESDVLERRCTEIAARLGDDADLVALLKEFLVRRNRAYEDRDKGRYGKLAYRQYKRRKISGLDDPFTALTMALVQKRLVKALDGKGNRFRQGECSSFESLSSSMKHRPRKDEDGNTVEGKEFEHLEGADKDAQKQEESPDRTFIDELNGSFHRAMSDGRSGQETSGVLFQMPHAKLNETAERLFQQNLRNGGNHKSLVFVRRLDTVDELLTLTTVRFQNEVDRRLELWREFLEGAASKNGAREELWSKNDFWGYRHTGEDAVEDEEEGADEDAVSSDVQDGTALERTGRLAYFQALKRYKDKSKENGMLASFQTRLLLARKLSSNPLRGFLLIPPDRDGLAPGAAEDEAWDAAEKAWQRLVELLLGRKKDVLCAPESRHSWLFSEGAKSRKHFWKRATLQRCIIQSLRQSDFLVDLFVLHRFTGRSGSPQEKHLTEKLLWFLGERREASFPPDLERYVENWKDKLRHWIEHFDLIVDKCLRSDKAREWHEIYWRVDGAFARMAPVFGRSGRLDDKNAVVQFKFPTHPNILVCTDVLKEGVDMHLFCDEVVHYGVAWSSGDLEQRIGRVDRFGSMISRKIERHSSKTEPAALLPRLTVEFPFLDGTLDRHQAERVIVAKIRNDLRIDLGKRKDQIGFLSVLDLETPDSPLLNVSMEAPQESYPEGCPGEDEPGPEAMLVPTEILPRPAHLRPWNDEVFERAHLPALGAVVVRKRLQGASPSDAGLLRQKAEREKRRKEVAIEEEYLVPLELLAQPVPADTDADPDDVALRDAPPSLEAAMQSGGPAGVAPLAPPDGFTFSAKWNTLVCSVRIDNPFESRQRVQSVLLERVGGFWLLRTPLFCTDDKVVEGASWTQWIRERNAKRRGRWGYLVEDHGIVWFVGFLLDFRGGARSGLLKALAERAGKIGDRLQHLYSASDDPEQWSYRSGVAFPSTALSGKVKALLTEKGGTIMSMDKDEMQQCGQLLFVLQAWLREAFTEVVGALYAGVPEEKRTLAISTVRLLPNGVLHVQADGAERFRLQAFLQLTGGSRESDLCPAPRLVWELAASPNTTGPKPKLELSSWDELPHQSRDDWEGQSNEHCGLFKFTGDRYRYLAVYHAPQAWDVSRKKMLAAWAKALESMQGSFNVRGCRENFFEAAAIG